MFILFSIFVFSHTLFFFFLTFIIMSYSIKTAEEFFGATFFSFSFTSQQKREKEKVTRTKWKRKIKIAMIAIIDVFYCYCVDNIALVQTHTVAVPQKQMLANGGIFCCTVFENVNEHKRKMENGVCSACFEYSKRVSIFGVWFLYFTPVVFSSQHQRCNTHIHESTVHRINQPLKRAQRAK